MDMRNDALGFMGKRRQLQSCRCRDDVIHEMRMPYAHDAERRTLRIDVTSSMESTICRVVHVRAAQEFHCL